MKTNLKASFEPVSSKEWKQKIQYELDGADFATTMVWNSPEDIQVKPFYHQDEKVSKYPIKTNASGFKICQKIFVFDLEKSIKRANNAVERGADCIRFSIENEKTDVIYLLKNIVDKRSLIFLDLNFISIDFVKKVDTFAFENQMQIWCNHDPIGYLAQEGNWIQTKEKDNFESLRNVLKVGKNIGTISINVGLYQNAGANMAQQIAYGLAHANEYFNQINNINKRLVFEISVGSNYFFEIAKLRAFRQLFKLIAQEYGHELDCFLMVTPSKRNKTIFDYNVNMLRSTTECMSAILGGADAISNLAYDAIFHKDNEFGDRISRNQLLILKNESYFDKVNNPADGSYYIENLTKQLSEKALKLFKDIETGGGFLKLLHQGIIKKKISESAQKEQDLFDNGKLILVGTNKYANKNDLMKDELELFPFVKIKARKTLITPIIEKRLAEKWEQSRLLDS